jgi:16S rRNA (uracil1498-N3)-methyltransferase
VTAPHFFVERLEAGAAILLSPADSAHALRSLRLKVGEELTLADGAGATARGKLAGERHGRAEVTVDAVDRVERARPLVSVALAPPKGDRLNWAVQKLAELGTDEVVLVPTERSVRSWAAEGADRIVERQRAVAREAAMQSRGPFVMDVRSARTLDEALCEPGRPAIMLSEGASRPLSQVLPPRADAIRILIGPEGGFSDAEVERADGAGAPVASLGSTILRTETAAVVGAALVLARYGRLG